MTYEEAIRIIEVAKAEVEWNYSLEYQEAFDVAIDCIEKQKPVKAEYHAPDFDARMFSWWTCGNCDCEIASIVDKYCSYCGRPIDWSEVE